MIDAAITRLKARVAALDNRIEDAADFAALMQSGNLPQRTPAAHVIPLGMQGRGASASAGTFKQDVSETLGVVLTIRGNDPAGSKALTTVETLIRDVIGALAGWAPDAETGVFVLTRANLVSMTRGTLVYQIDFTIDDQLRITP